LYGAFNVLATLETKDLAREIKYEEENQNAD